MAILLPMAVSEGPKADPALVAPMIALAAWQRTKSRGAHFRSDCPSKAAVAHRSRLSLKCALEAPRDFATGTPSPCTERLR